MTSVLRKTTATKNVVGGGAKFQEGGRVMRKRRKFGKPREIGFTAAAAIAKRLKKSGRVPKQIPERFQNMIKYWPEEMLDSVIKSRGTRVMADQPNTVRLPADFSPRAEVPEQFRLSEEQIRFFWENGYLAPIKACEPEEMDRFRAMVDTEVFDGDAYTPSKIYDGTDAGRDRHLDSPSLVRLMDLPMIRYAVAQLMGPDLQVWRTQMLPKHPGSQETAWHQVSTFTLTGQAMRPILEPPDLDELFNVTVWLAIDEATMENGCMRFLRGSHLEPIREYQLVDDGKGMQDFVSLTFRLDGPIPQDRIGYTPLKPGEFLIFHERCVHGAERNRTTTDRRLGMNFRIATTDTRVYEGMDVQVSRAFGDVYRLDNWRSVVINGEDRPGHTRRVSLEKHKADLGLGLE